VTDFADFKTQIAEWSNRQDWSDALVTSFVRMAETKFNTELRVDRMIANIEAIIINRCAPLPDDWLEMDLVRIQNSKAADGWFPIQYQPRHIFYSLKDQDALGFYTIEGRQIYFGGAPDSVNGINFKLVYYSEVPVFSDTVDSWVYTKQPSLYLFAALMHADLHAIGEENSAANLKQLVEDTITKLNADHLRARASGSRLSQGRRRSFG
jgi:hypothetical protein